MPCSTLRGSHYTFHLGVAYMAEKTDILGRDFAKDEASGTVGL